MAKGTWTPETPWFKSDKETQAHWPSYVCRNPNCKSVGKSHPNCKCGAPSFSKQSKSLEYDAKGGEVGSHYCSLNNAHHEECEHFADGGEIEANNEFFNNPDLSLDHAIVNHGAHHVLTKTGHTKSEDHGRAMHDHLEHVKQGRRNLHGHSKNILETKKEHRIESNPEHVQGLKAHLEDLQANPQKLFDVGGSLGDDLPDHAGILGAKTATMMKHLETIKPKSQQMNPMSEPIKPSKGEEYRYNRQLALMQNPTLAYQAIKDGMLQPDDLNTIKAVYPKLFDKMKDHLMSAMIEAKTNGKPISYKHRMGLSQIMGQPLDWTQSQKAAQAIIQANGVQQPQSQGKPGKAPSQAVLKQLNKVDALGATPLEEEKINQKA